MNDSQLEIRAYRSLDELLTISESWEELLASYPLATTFSTPAWLGAWWRTFGSTQELLVAGCFANSQLVALAPFSITPVRVGKTIPLRQLRLMGDGSNDSDNLDLPVRPGFEDQFAASLLEFLESERKSWDFAELNTFPPQSPGANALRQLLAQKKWVAIEKHRPASAIPLPATWAEYVGQLSSEDQKNLVRYARRLEKRYSVQVYRCNAESQLPKCLNALFALHQARWGASGERGSFSVQERTNFYFELSSSLLAQGRLDLWVLELDGGIAAAQFGFRYGRQFFQLQEGNDPKRASDRVGFILRGHVLKQLIADGVRTYDFLGGELGYKARWGAQRRDYSDIQFARPFTLGSVYIQMLRAAAQSKHWLRGKLPKRAWDVLHKINIQVRAKAAEADLENAVDNESGGSKKDQAQSEVRLR
jgi:CelD/BcsL family acetyltransferase involved in cellulose biosynthesis